MYRSLKRDDPCRNPRNAAIARADAAPVRAAPPCDGTVRAHAGERNTAPATQDLLQRIMTGRGLEHNLHTRRLIFFQHSCMPQSHMCSMSSSDSCRPGEPLDELSAAETHGRAVQIQYERSRPLLCGLRFLRRKII